MAKLDEFIFGYYRGRVNADVSCKLANLMLKQGICSSIDPSGEFRLKQKDVSRFSLVAKGKIRYDIGSPRGIYGFILQNRQRYGLFISLILTILIAVISSGLVWDVRISGNERLPDYVIEDALDNVGFGVGTLWRAIDKNKIESELLIEREDIAWISVNRRGTVAYVEIIESENVGIREDVGPLYSNIVADRDGVIEEINVRSGIANVKIGDVVKKGDVLISGVLENESGTVFCRAQGYVRAESVCEVVAEAERETVVKSVIGKSTSYIKLVLFNFSINIFKNYGNYENTCDIIEEIRGFALFDKYELPIRIEKVYAYEYMNQAYTRSDDEIIAAAKQELDSKIYTVFKDADVLKLRTVGEFYDLGYRLTSRVVYSAEIGNESAIEIN